MALLPPLSDSQNGCPQGGCVCTGGNGLRPYQAVRSVTGCRLLSLCAPGMVTPRTGSGLQVRLGRGSAAQGFYREVRMVP